MRLTTKSHDQTWRNRSGRKSDLDHVFVSDTVDLVDLGTRPDGGAFETEVIGWNGLSKAAANKFYDQLSDHSALFVRLRPK